MLELRGMPAVVRPGRSALGLREGGGLRTRGGKVSPCIFGRMRPGAVVVISNLRDGDHCPEVDLGPLSIPSSAIS
ncbi:hypothetical protein GCM10010256_73040 [Streptomyces coeruleorubidus]|nr:hypothetical protein GCM10010256_73040 [Streptomyces coeruleorubidus]